jgi:predicted membrane-bound mannosyltransferase
VTALPNELGRRKFLAALLAILVCAGLLRTLFLAADPPWYATVGIVWHDEGAWTHNARNKALFGEWSLDAWNPMYIAPVFTGLEYTAFEVFGVGLRQARLVPAVLGLLSVALLSLGVRRIAGDQAGLAAGALLATNFVYVMWNRTAMMEGPMVAFIVMAWYCYVRAQAKRAWWGWLAGTCALLAFFTKGGCRLLRRRHRAGRDSHGGHGVAHGRGRRCAPSRGVGDARRPRRGRARGPGDLRGPELGRVPLLQLRDVGGPQAVL